MTWISDSGNGETKGETQFSVGDSGSNQFGDNGHSAIDFDGNSIGGSGGSSSSVLGMDCAYNNSESWYALKVILVTIILYSACGSRARNGFEYFDAVSKDSGFNLGSSDQQGFGVIEIGGNGKSSSGSAGSKYLSPGSDVRGSGILTLTLFLRNPNEFLPSLFFQSHFDFSLGEEKQIWSSGSENSGGRKGATGLGASTSGPNEFGEVGVSSTGTCDAGKGLTGSDTHSLRI